MRIPWLVLPALLVVVPGCKAGGGSNVVVDGGGALSCGASVGTDVTGAPWVPAADPQQPIHATFTATIDPTNTKLSSEWLQPHPEAISLSGGGSGLTLWGGVKPFANHPGRLLVEMYLVNSALTGLAGATATVSELTGSATFYDLNADPLAAAGAVAPMTVGGVAPEGVSSHIRFAFDADASNDPIAFMLAIDATTTGRTSTDVVAHRRDCRRNRSVVGARRRERRQRDRYLEGGEERADRGGGAPFECRDYPDGALVLVASADCDQLMVIDRATRAVVQVFGEADGIGRDARNVVLSPTAPMRT